MQNQFNLSQEKWEFLFNNLYQPETIGNNRLFLNQAMTDYFIKNSSCTAAMSQYFKENYAAINYLLSAYKSKNFSYQDTSLEQSLIKKYSKCLLQLDIYQHKISFLSQMDLLYQDSGRKIKLHRLNFFNSLKKDGLELKDFFDSSLDTFNKENIAAEKFLNFYLNLDFKKDNLKAIELLKLLDKKEHRTFTSTILDKRIGYLSRLDRDYYTLDYLVSLLDKNSNSTFFKKIEKECSKYSPTLLKPFTHRLTKDSMNAEIDEYYIIALKIDPVTVERTYKISANTSANYLNAIGISVKNILTKEFKKFDFSYDKGVFEFKSYSLEDKEKMRNIAQIVKENFSALIQDFNNGAPIVNAKISDDVLDKILFHQKLDHEVTIKDKKRTHKI